MWVNFPLCVCVCVYTCVSVTSLHRLLFTWGCQMLSNSLSSWVPLAVSVACTSLTLQKLHDALTENIWLLSLCCCQLSSYQQSLNRFFKWVFLIFSPQKNQWQSNTNIFSKFLLSSAVWPNLKAAGAGCLTAYSTAAVQPRYAHVCIWNCCCHLKCLCSKLWLKQQNLSFRKVVVEHTRGRYYVTGGLIVEAWLLLRKT